MVSHVVIILVSLLPYCQIELAAFVFICGVFHLNRPVAWNPDELRVPIATSCPVAAPSRPITLRSQPTGLPASSYTPSRNEFPS
jgi:hypothetical protein